MKVNRSISKAMEAALGITEEVNYEKIEHIAGNVNNSCIEKIAGIFIDNPTPENIEDFVRKYVYNELTFFPRILEISVQLLPSSFDRIKKDNVDIATGMVQIKIRSKMVELPFMVSEGQLQPFDVIQLDGTRAPFSRENFQKILLNLEKQLEMEERGQTTDSVYEGLEDFTNPTTSAGFMGDVLAIRDSNSFSNGEGTYVTASTEYTDAEKKAGLFVSKQIQDLGKDRVLTLLSNNPEFSIYLKNETGIDINKISDNYHFDKSSEEFSENILKSAGFDSESSTQKSIEKQAFGFGFGFGFNKDRSQGKYEREDSNEMMYGYKHGDIHKSANDLDAMGPGWSENKGSLESSFEEAVKKAEKEKYTTKAPEIGKKEVNEIEINASKTDAVKTAEFREDHKITKKNNRKDINEELAVLKKNATEYVVTDFNSIMEKIAKVNPITENDIEYIQYMFNKKSAEIQKKEMQKLAAEDEKDLPTKKELENIKKMVDFKFDNASNLSNGTFIVFPEFNGADISMIPAVILESSKNDLTSVKVKFVCTNDNRIKILKGESFLCKKVDNPFKFNMTELKTLKEKDSFFAIKGDTIINPMSINYINSLSYGDGINLNTINTMGYCFNTIEISESDKNKSGLDVLCRKSSCPTKDHQILTLEDFKFHKISVDDYLQAKSKEKACDEGIIKALLPYTITSSKEVIVSSESTKVIKISGTIRNYFKSEKDFNDKRQFHEAGHDLTKIAFTLNTITIQCVDRRVGIYNVSIDYKDTEERFFNLRNQNFNRVKEGKLRAILRIIKFQGNKLNEIIYKAKNEPRAVYPIPLDCTAADINKLFGGNLTNVSKKTITDTINKYVNPLSIAKGVATATMGTMIANSAKGLIGSNGLSNTGLKAINLIQKMSSESAVLSSSFEKKAQELEDNNILDLSRVLALSHYYGEKVAHIINDTHNSYPGIKGVTRDILAARPVLEKIAYNTARLKINQGFHKVASIDNNELNRAIANIDYLYKIAIAVDKSIDTNDLKFISK